jgi:hypothetical protein
LKPSGAGRKMCYSGRELEPSKCLAFVFTMCLARSSISWADQGAPDAFSLDHRQEFHESDCDRYPDPTRDARKPIVRRGWRRSILSGRGRRRRRLRWRSSERLQYLRVSRQADPKHLGQMTDRVRIIKHEAVKDYGSFEVHFPDGRPSVYFTGTTSRVGGSGQTCWTVRLR